MSETKSTCDRSAGNIRTEMSLTEGPFLLQGHSDNKDIQIVYFVENKVKVQIAFDGFNCKNDKSTKWSTVLVNRGLILPQVTP